MLKINLMRKLIQISIVAIFTLSLAACGLPRPKHPPKHPGKHPAKLHAKPGKIPPGQAKKIFGTKSAKPFAPGQNK